VIAGRRRLAAAVAAGLLDVPCVTYDVSDTEAAALAEADNLRTAASSASPPAPAEPRLHETLLALSSDLAGMGLAAALLRSGGSSGFSNQVAADLIQAQTWRAAWLARAAAVTAAPHRVSRLRPLGAILERVRAGFEAEAKLTSLRLDCSIAPEAASLTFDDDFSATALAGCVFATLAWLKGAEDPRMEIRVEAPRTRALKLEVVQRIAPVTEDVAGYLRASERARLADLTAMLGLLTARLFAAHYGGGVEFTAMSGGGSVLQLTASRQPEN
jgi:hypothetical protein